MAAARLVDDHDLRIRPTVLVVEDEVLVRLVIADALRSQGFPVVEAANADEALTILQSSAAVDLMITDIQMPGPMDGLALTALARAGRPGLKVVIVSGHAAAPPSAELSDAFFRKPYDLLQVLQRVNAILAGGDS
jgi:CheY-like chemotaxis protein